MNKHLLLKTALALAVASPLMASAESNRTLGNGDATARLDFRVEIPRVLFLAVGTGSAGLTPNSTVDEVVFDYSTNPQDVGTGAAADTITGNAVQARVFGNDGPIQIAASTGDLTDTVSGETIPLSQINASVTGGDTNLAVPAPNSNVVIPVNAGRVTNRTATWTYSFANTTPAGAGTYEGTITYTASMP